MHEKISANNVCFPGANFPTLAGYWRELNARRVSFTSQDVLGDFDAAHAVMKTGDYKLETIVHQFRYKPLDSVDDNWREDRDKLSTLIRSSAELGAVSIYLITGGRGKLSWEAAAERFSEAVKPCVPQAKDAGVQLIIENTMPMYVDVHLGTTLDDTAALARMAGIGVLIDIYACWTQSNLKASIERAVPLCGLVQVSDYVFGDRSFPSRAVPGEGNIPLDQIIQWIVAAGYKGAFDLELLGPRIDKIGHVEAVRRADAYVSKILSAVGG
jgi:sugar phosphate isomerase/epimerase